MQIGLFTSVDKNDSQSEKENVTRTKLNSFQKMGRVVGEAREKINEHV